MIWQGHDSILKLAELRLKRHGSFGGSSAVKRIRLLKRRFFLTKRHFFSTKRRFFPTAPDSQNLCFPIIMFQFGLQVVGLFSTPPHPPIHLTQSFRFLVGVWLQEKGCQMRKNQCRKRLSAQSKCDFLDVLMIRIDMV